MCHQKSTVYGCRCISVSTHSLNPGCTGAQGWFLTVYGHPHLSCTPRVAATLHEKQVPFKLVVVDLLGKEQKSPAYLEKQPFGQIPVLEDDGYRIYETRAICRYIAEKYAGQGTTLIPTDLKAKGIFEQAASVEYANWGALCEQGGYRESLQGMLVSLEANLDVYDKILAKQKWVAGDEFTLADLFHMPYAALLPRVGRDVIAARPNVARWAKELLARPSWQAVKDGVQVYCLNCHGS
ncbi:glutathione S-transferase [Ephemerocybe angulata]|uniref:glutathione transferase n=1 Tax=Ephemerocybe angulata TaxID=980116 RepID=A0A8H6M6A9_9AGAR|nr:glutathione S-transferase [Tulosesus angulatus]